MPFTGSPRATPLGDLEEGRVALPDARRVDRREVREHLTWQRRHVRTTRHDMRARVFLLDQLGHHPHAATIRGPARHSPKRRLESLDDFLDARPCPRRQVDDLHVVPCADRLRSEGEEPVRSLVEVRVEIALAVPLRRALRVGIRHAPLGSDLPRRRVEQYDLHGITV